MYEDTKVEKQRIPHSFIWIVDRGRVPACCKMVGLFQAFFSFLLFGKFKLLFFFVDFILPTQSVQCCPILAPILADDFADFGPDSAQSRFEFGAIVV